MDKQNI